MKSRILLLLFVSIAWSGAADAVTINFFNSSQTATLEATGETSDTISSTGYLFTYTRDKLYGGGTGRPVRVTWPEGVEAQAMTVGPAGKAQITISRVDGNIFDIPAFTVKLLANTVGAGASIEVMPLLNGEDGYPDPILFSATGLANQTFSYDTHTKPQSTSLLTGFDTYKISLYVDFAVTAITLVDAGIPPPTDFYVSALGGNDLTGDGSSSAPWLTITHALSQIADSADPIAILITDYAYAENVLVDKNGLVINLIGGCDGGFITCAARTIIQGALEIVNGTVIVENIVVEP